ncbi:UNVERIFIED_CONTAM: hypothetical protein K2H54_067207 [Gekko kuhli]
MAKLAEGNYRDSHLDSITDKQDIAMLLERMENRLCDRITQSTQPIKDLTAQTAEMALKTSSTTKIELQELRKSETQTRDCLLIVEAQIRNLAGRYTQDRATQRLKHN